MSLLNYFFNKKDQSSSEDSKSADPDFIEDRKDHVEDNSKVEDTDAAKAASGISEEEVYPILEREILPTKIICPDCGGITLEGLEFCDKCGGELQ